MPYIARVISVITGANIRTPHDGRYVEAWDPDTCYGMLAVTSTSDARRARRFETVKALMDEYSAVSRKQPTRPTDGEPNRPLRGLTIEIVPADPGA